MKYIFPILLLLNSVFVSAEVECQVEKGSLGELIAVTGQKCFSDEVSPQDLQDLAKDEVLALCKSCKSEVINNHLTNPEGAKEKKVVYGNATLNEFQKELTLISLDLMKMRSSFKLNLDAKKITSSCSFNKENLRRPSCLKGDDLIGFNKKAQEIQDRVATEISNILSEKPEASGGLLMRKEREGQCNFSERDILFSKSRFNETLMTPELITELKKQNLNGKISLASLEKDPIWEKKFYSLKSHPLLNVLLNDPVKLSNFVNEIGSEDNNAQIIEKLYKSKHTQSFGDAIKHRCEQSFKTTSEYLEKIYCNPSSDFVAEDIMTMESVVGSKFISMDEKDAEKNLQTVCSHVNTKKSNSLSFEQIQKSINGKNNQNLAKLPITQFRGEAFDQVFNQDKISMCKALGQSPPCAKDDKSVACLQLHFLKQAKESQEYKTLANSSNEDINQILHSLIGEGLPQKDGKPDAEAIALLKSEGILPGGDNTSRPPQQTAADFHKAVSSAAFPQPQQAAKPAKIAAPSKTEEPQPSYAQSAARGSDSDDEQDSTASRSDSPTKHKSPKKQNSKFSNLSDDEQQRIMDMMKRSKKAGGKTPTAASSDEQDSSDDAIDTAGTAMANIAAQAAASGASVANVGQKTVSAGATAGKKAVLDPTKKSSSLNDAMVDANTNRQLASSGSGLSSSNAQVSISKSGANENEIKIKVADAELTQVNEFKEKLKVLLNAHSQEISVAGAGEKFVVKLNNFEINVVFNKQLGTYEALCKDSSIPKDYLKTISTYFNVTLKGSTGKREALVNTLKQ